MDIFLRKIQEEDIEQYWEEGFKNPDKEMLYYTGTTSKITKEGIVSFVHKIINEEERCHFLIWNKEGKLLGEISLMDIDDENNSCIFRIAIFKSQYFGQGIGYKATKEAIRFAFEELKLHRVELEVFDYNNRAKAMYKKVGFREEGRRRDGIFINGQYHDVIIMSMLKYECN